MKTIDYVYRFDPKNPSVKPPPPDAEAARCALQQSNLLFSKWMESCRTGSLSPDAEPRYVVQCNGLEVGMVRAHGEVPQQAPFAVVVGCSDARVPVEMLFGQGFSDLFVIRVAGNVLADECLGSIDFALTALRESVKVLVVLGHSGCGGVTAAVDAYLNPQQFWSRRNSITFRSILQRIFVAVREAAKGLEIVWGPDATKTPGYREALIETAVCINAAQAAYTLHIDAERSRSEVQVMFGVYNLRSHQVSMPHDPFAPPADDRVNIADAPTNPRDFNALAVQMAEVLLPRAPLFAAGKQPGPLLPGNGDH
jgi:carbonic anhydrase